MRVTLPDTRSALLAEWLAGQLHTAAFEIAPASSDASFRRYFRIAIGDRTWIAMDAPPPQEDCRPFVAIARLLRAAGVNAPEIVGEDLERGFLLLSDLGSTTYLAALNATSAPRLYADANAALVRMQSAVPVATLPAYDRALLARELALYPDWYVTRQKAMRLSDAALAAWSRGCEVLLANNLAQPVVFVHRDYHSRNLMVCADGANPGILDFQDAVAGPITYDLVSLYKDAYIRWDEAFVLDEVARYWSEAKRAGLPVDPDFAAFYRDFEWMGVQRQLKVLGIFARLFHRDGKAVYLGDMPRVLAGLTAACARYRELAPLRQVVDEVEANLARTGYSP
jgi:aminoglycoside/choline kinase family phosphotransferase